MTDHRAPCSWRRTGTAGCCGPARWSSAQPRRHDRCLHWRSPDRPCRRTRAGSFSIRWKRKGEDTQRQPVNDNSSDNSSLQYSAYQLWLLNRQRPPDVGMKETGYIHKMLLETFHRALLRWCVLTFTMSEISFHCSGLGSTPVGLWAQACNMITLCSGIFCHIKK